MRCFARSLALPIAGLALLAAALSGCNGAETVACRDGSTAAPVPKQACIESEEGREWVLEVVHDFSDVLLGRHTHPGRARASMRLDEDGEVADACLREATPGEVTLRAVEAVDELWDADDAPACMAGRRVEIEWESPEITHEDIRNATRRCSRNSAHGRYRAFCLQARDCEATDQSVFYRFRREFAACLLHELPLVFGLREAPDAQLTIHPFLPEEGSAPSLPEGASAYQTCLEADTLDGLVACMHERGWEPDA